MSAETTQEADGSADYEHWIGRVRADVAAAGDGVDWKARAEAAERRLDTIRIHCDGHLKLEGICCPHLAHEILAIISSEEQDRG